MKNTTVTIGSARIDERGRTTGGKAGDQAREISTQPWYKHSKGWIVIRPKEAIAAERIAEAMERACANPRIGYDQAQRLSLWNAVKDYGYDPAKVPTLCETDCSALVRVCCAYAGIITPNFTTADEVKTLKATGWFDILTDVKQSQLLRGDILCTKTKSHTAVVLSNGSKAESRPIALGARRLILLSIQNIVLDGRTRTASTKAHRCAFAASYDFVGPEVKTCPSKICMFQNEISITCLGNRGRRVCLLRFRHFIGSCGTLFPEAPRKGAGQPVSGLIRAGSSVPPPLTESTPASSSAARRQSVWRCAPAFPLLLPPVRPP